MKRIIDSLRKKKDVGGSDVVIGCRGCGSHPCLDDTGCLRCICGNLKDRDARTLTLVSSNEIMFDGDALRELSRLSNLLSPDSIVCGASIRCRNCGLYRDRLMDGVWEALNEDNLTRIISSVDSEGGECIRASACRASARESLTRMREEMLQSAERCRMLAHRFMGV